MPKLFCLQSRKDFSINSSGAKFQTTSVVCVFFFLLFFNYRMERSLHVKLKDRSSNSVDPLETAFYEPFHLDLRCLRKPIIIDCGSERVKGKNFLPFQTGNLCQGNKREVTKFVALENGRHVQNIYPTPPPPSPPHKDSPLLPLKTWNHSLTSMAESKKEKK